MTSDSAARDAAIKRLHQKQAFQAMLLTFVVVNVLLWAIWAFSDDKSGMPWPIWVTGWWGLGVAVTAWNIYGRKPITEADVQREMQKSKGVVDASDD